MRSYRKCYCGFSLKAGTTLMLCSTLISYSMLMFVGIVTHDADLDKSMAGCENNWLLNYYKSRQTIVLNLCLIFILIGLVGLYGVHTNKPTFLIPYILYRIVLDLNVIVVVIPILVDLPWRCYFPKPICIESLRMCVPFNKYSVTFAIFAGLEIIFVAVEVYFIWIIYSCYNKMIRERKILIRSDLIPMSTSRIGNK